MKRIGSILCLIIILFFLGCQKEESKESIYLKESNIPEGIKLGEMLLQDEENNIENRIYFPIFRGIDRRVELEPINKYINSEIEKYKAMIAGEHRWGYLRIKPSYISFYNDIYSCCFKKTFTIGKDSLVEYKTINYSHRYNMVLGIQQVFALGGFNIRSFFETIDDELRDLRYNDIWKVDFCFYNDSIIFAIQDQDPRPKHLQTRYIKSIDAMESFFRRDILNTLRNE